MLRKLKRHRVYLAPLHRYRPLDYIADKLCVELKSLKLYAWSYRDQGHFHEAVTNLMLDDLAKAVKPRFMRLTARFYVRGGIFRRTPQKGLESHGAGRSGEACWAAKYSLDQCLH